MRFKWGPLAIIAPIYYLGKLIGALPIGYRNDCENKLIIKSDNFQGRKHGKSHDISFNISTCGVIIWATMFSIQIWSFFRMSSYLTEALMQRKLLDCSMDNFCSVFGLLLSHSVISPLIVFVTVFRLRKTVNCFNMTTVILLRCRYPRRLSVNAFMIFAFLVIFLIGPILVLLNFPKTNADLFYPYFIGHISPLILVNLISILCLVTQHAYQDINRELEELCHVQSKSERVLRLSALMDDHWFLEDYVECLSNTFGPDLMFVMTDTYIQMLLFLYVMIWETLIRGVHTITYTFTACVAQLFVNVTKFLYLCYRCDSPIQASKRTIFHIQHLSFALYNEPVCQAILKTFTIRVNTRQEKVTASGFIDINMSLVCKTAGVVLTYFLVLIQIQSENYKYWIRSNVNTSAAPVTCESWPCLRRNN